MNCLKHFHEWSINIADTQCLPEQFDPPVGTDPTHVSPAESGIEGTNK